MVSARAVLLPLASCLVLTALSLLPQCLAAPEAQEGYYLGGADADRSYFERSVSGVKVAFHFFFKAFGDDRNTRTSKKVELALVGFGRTGTTSLVSALQLLGYTFLHDDTLPEVADLHAKVANKKDPMPMEGFVEECGKRGFDAIFFFSDDFLKWAAKTDGVKVILSTRDSGRKWAESWLVIACMVDFLESRPFIWSSTLQDLLPGYFQLIYKNISTQGQPEKYKDLATLESAYEAHLVKVRKMIPPDRLLEFNVKEGWEPLCKFLGKSVPDTKFPHVNDRVVVNTIVLTFWLITWIWPVGPPLVVYLLWAIGRTILKRLRGGAAAHKKPD